MADTAIKKKKLEIMEFPTISNQNTGQYDKLKNESKPKTKREKVVVDTPAPSNINIPDAKEVAKKIEKMKVKIFGFNMPKIRLTLFYVAVLVLAAFSKIWVLYSTMSLSYQKNEIKKNLADLKAEVEGLESTYITNYDLKQIEKKAKAMGYVPKTIQHVDIKD